MAELPSWVHGVDPVRSAEAGGRIGLSLREHLDNADLMRTKMLSSSLMDAGQMVMQHKERAELAKATNELKQAQLKSIDTYRQVEEGKIVDAKEREARETSDMAKALREIHERKYGPSAGTLPDNAAVTPSDWQPGMQLPNSSMLTLDKTPAGTMGPIQNKEPADLLDIASRYPSVMKNPAFHSLVTEDAIRRRGEGKPSSPIGKIQSDLSDAMKRGDAQSVEELKAALAEATSNHGRSIYMGQDDQGRPIFQMTEGGAKAIKPATVATQSQAQSTLMEQENAMGLINYLQKNLKPEHVGLAGKAGELLVDKTLAQLVPGVADKARINSRDTIGWLRESLLRKISDDKSGRYSKADREEIEQLIPSDGVFESFDRAQTSLQRARDILSDRARVYSSRIGEKRPLWSMKPEEIKSEYQKFLDTKGKQGVSYQEAEDALSRFH